MSDSESVISEGMQEFIEEERRQRIQLETSDRMHSMPSRRGLRLDEQRAQVQQKVINDIEREEKKQKAAEEKVELEVIETFLPAQLSEEETKAAIEAIKTETGAAGMKDMGKVMAELKARHGTVLDMSKASGWVKAALS